MTHIGTAVQVIPSAGHVDRSCGWTSRTYETDDQAWDEHIKHAQSVIIEDHTPTLPPARIQHMRLADVLNPTLELTSTETTKVLEFIRHYDALVTELVEHRVELPVKVETQLGRIVLARRELDKVWEG